MAPKLHCAKCKTTDSPEYIPIEYPEDDGTTTTHYGCTWCIEDMGNFVDARREHLVNHGDHRHTV
jgi:hypothetical protein